MTFFDKLTEDMKIDQERGIRKNRIKVTKAAKDYLLTNDEVKEVEWNGREIRNAFQTAVALAEYDALQDPDHLEDDPITVEETHFKNVVGLTAKFRKYMVHLAGGDDSKRALQSKSRYDFEPPGSHVTHKVA